MRIIKYWNLFSYISTKDGEMITQQVLYTYGITNLKKKTFKHKTIVDSSSMHIHGARMLNT